MYKIFTAIICRACSCIPPKFLRVMKLTIVMWAFALIQVNAASYAQKVNIRVVNASMDDVLTNLSVQTGYNFIYNSAMIRTAKPVTLNAVNKSLTEALESCFKNQPLQFLINGNTVVIKQRATPVASNTSTISRSAIPIVVTGTVTDNKGQPLAGVSISLKGTTIGTATNADGKFSLKVPDDDGIITFNLMGYNAQQIAVKGKNILNVMMEEAPSALNEVVVVGYGTQQKKDVISAVSSIKGRDIENLPVATPQSLIQGRATGVQVIQNSGSPGGGVTVRIRGTTSINAGNDPLYIIDGIPVESGTLNNISLSGSQPSALAAINADDIESMEVLKDAGALAIYGSRAANGVVLITTKHGKKGSTAFNLNYYTGWQQDNPNRRVKLMNSQQAIDLIQEGRANALSDGITSLYGFLLPAPDGTLSNTDWQKELFRTAPISNYELSVRGGENKLRFALSGSYLDQQGIIIKSGFTRGTGRINLDYDASRKFKLGTNLSLSRYTNNRVSTDDGSSSLIQVALKKSPSLPIYNPDGTYYQGDVSGFINPVAFANKIKYVNQVSTVKGNIYGEYTFLPKLVLRSTAGLDYDAVTDQFFQPSDAVRNGVAVGEAFNSNVTGWIIENTLSYAHDLGKHHLTGLLGYSQQERSSFALNGRGTPYSTNNIYTLNAATTPTSVSSSMSAYGLSSAFARLSYAYNDKYLLEASARRDGSSRFGANKRYSIFPAVSAAWRVSNEAFWSKSSAVNDLKFRASVGKTGNQTIGDYVAQGQYSTGANYIGQSGIALTTLPNPDLTWETTLQYNAGLDISLFASRISFTMDAYVKNTSNLLLQVPLPNTSGFGFVLQNIGATQNKGLEFGLNTVNIDNKDVSWRSNFNISFNRNKVVQLYGGADNIIQTVGAGLSGSLTSYNILQVGSPIGSLYGWRESGVYRNSADNTAKITSTSFGTNGYVFKGGDMIFQDLNGNGTIDIDDRMIIGNAQPKFTGGFTNTVAWRNFDLNLLMTFSYGNDIVNGTRYAAESATGFNGSVTLLNRWRNEGDITDIPRANYVDPAGNRRFSNRWIEDGSYLRAKNLTIGYKLPTSLLEKVKVKSCRFYATAQNLFTLTRYTGYDPEASSIQLGVDQGTYPQYRAYIFGINVGF
jgi:TonB-linked SusC/RagA family outer membrane protein